jgi:hypothetical protein
MIKNTVILAAVLMTTAAYGQTITEKYTIERSITMPQQSAPVAPAAPTVSLTCPKGDDTVSINAVFDPNTMDAMRFSVGHQLANGGFYDRGRQYYNTTGGHTPGKWEYYWSGYAKNFRNTVMVGKLMRNDSGQWLYGEETIVNGHAGPVTMFECY